MKKQYQVPELKLVGQADAVVLGQFGVGDDIRDEFVPLGAEFQDDQDSPQLPG